MHFTFSFRPMSRFATQVTAALLVAAISLTAPLAAQAPAAPAPADVIVINGRIYTADGARPIVDAMAVRGGRMMLEYVTISGENVGEEDALALIDRLAGMPVRLNLIDVNDATGSPGSWRLWRQPIRSSASERPRRGAVGALGAAQRTAFPIRRRIAGSW